MTAELQVQENARRFATTRETWVRQTTNSLLDDLDKNLAGIAASRRAGALSRPAALQLALRALAVPAEGLAELERREKAAT